MSKKVLVNGACGRMGQEVVKTVVNDTEELLVGAFDQKYVGEDIVEKLGLDGPECIVQDNLEQAITTTEPDVIIDFTSPQIVMENIKIGLTHNVHMIVGTTGITETDMEEIDRWTAVNKANALVVPNFALGAVLMMKFAGQAAKYLSDVEIIELHHDQKIDAPSGTAMKTASIINENLGNSNSKKEKVESIEKLSGARGGEQEGIHIHSIRLQGLVAHQEVIFGGEGQSLTIRHDSYDRTSFMPGVRMALDSINKIDGFVYGLEKILD